MILFICTLIDDENEPISAREIRQIFLKRIRIVQTMLEKFESKTIYHRPFQICVGGRTGKENHIIATSLCFQNVFRLH